jgi:butyrate kinase
MKLLIVNPGSTSTKIGVFEDETQVFDKTLRHEREELDKFDRIMDQYDFRKNIVLDALKEAGISVDELSAVVGMGGLVKSIPGGTYTVNERMIEDLRVGVQGEHPSNLGGLIAYEIAKGIAKPSFIVDPVVVDEFKDISRISGHPLLERRSIFHALNQRAIAHQYCKEVGKRYEDLNLIVTHMGGGISIGMHEKGIVVDANNALNGDGPFTPERSGGLPVGDLVSLCFSGKYSEKEIKSMITGKGGMTAYFNSNNIKKLEERAASDPKVKLVIDAMVYQIAKEIAAMSVVVNGKVDAILLTGGIAYNDYIIAELTKRLSFITEVKRYPGEDELAALAQGALRVLRNEEPAKVYT